MTDIQGEKETKKGGFNEAVSCQDYIPSIVNEG
jgi:hypothetical protein